LRGRIAADDVFCAHCGQRSRWLRWLPAPRPNGADLRPSWSWLTTELDASFILQKDSNLVGRTDPH
jgi:hypothetical protein